MISLEKAKAPEAVKVNALRQLEKIAEKDSVKSKVREVIKNSNYSHIFSEYLLANNPIAWRNGLEHNKYFEAEATSIGIDTQKLSHNIEDSGITINLNYNTDLEMEKLVNYANEVKKQAEQLKENIISGLNIDKTPPEIELFKLGAIDYSKLPPELGKKLKVSVYKAINSKDYQNIQVKLNKDNYSDYPEQDEFDDVFEAEKSIILENNVEPMGINRNIDLEDDLNKRYYEQRDIQEEILTEAISKVLVPNFEENYKIELGQYYNLMIKKENITKEDFKQFTKNQEGQEKINEIKRTLSDSLHKLEIIDLQNVKNEYFYSFTKFRPEHHLPGYEIVNIQNHIDDVKFELSSKLKNIKEATYSVKLEPLLPTDVTFGNDGGCCMAIGDQGGGADNVPYYMIDKGTIVFGIYQKIKDRKPKRVGMVLSFATSDPQSNPVLLCNSYELSSRSNALNSEGLSKLVNHVNDYVINFAKKTGFKKVAIGNHDYNTAKNFTNSARLKNSNPEMDELVKLPDNGNFDFYSEVLEDTGLSKQGKWSWLE